MLYLALAAALGTATIYPLQPAIAEVTAALGSSTEAVGVALACGPIGYLCGLALLVPLVDRFPARRVIAVQFGALAVVIGWSAAVTQVLTLGLAVLMIGVCSSIGAGLSSVAGRLAAPGRRATVLGVVTAGISAGILAGRIVGGWLTDALGWRGMLLIFAAGCAVVAGSVVLVLPRVDRVSRSGYFATLGSLPGLYRRFAGLRRAAIAGTAWFFAFCAVWSGLAVALSAPPYGYSADRIGLYAAAGLLGIFATRISGILTDRFGARSVIMIGLIIAGAAAVLLGVSLDNPVVTLICLGLFDAGLFAAQVANQSTVLALDPQAPARFNSAYLVIYFVGGSLGTAFGAAAYSWIGWTGITLFSVAAILTAIALTASNRLIRNRCHCAS